MRSLKIFFLFVLVNFGFGSGLAQSPDMQMTDAQKEKMKENLQAFYDVLDLNGDQKKDFEAITKKYALQMKAVKDEGGSKMSMYKKIKSINKNKNAEMKGVLSKEQYEVYLEKQKEIQKEMRSKKK